MKNDRTARLSFEAAFAEMEKLCLRDARDLRKFKPAIWGYIRRYHNVTHTEPEDCVQLVMEIVAKGCAAFYRAQYLELKKYYEPTDDDKAKVLSRAKLSTWLMGHVEKKYDSLMSGFFAPIRAFESGRVRVKENSLDAAGERVFLDGEPVQVPGTLVLSRFNVDDPTSPLKDASDDRLHSHPDLAAAMREFATSHASVIDLIVSLDEQSAKKKKMIDCMHLGPIARQFGMNTKDFFIAVRGLFSGHTNSVQSV